MFIDESLRRECAERNAIKSLYECLMPIFLVHLVSIVSQGKYILTLLFYSIFYCIVPTCVNTILILMALSDVETNVLSTLIDDQNRKIKRFSEIYLILDSLKCFRETSWNLNAMNRKSI